MPNKGISVYDNKKIGTILKAFTQYLYKSSLRLTQERKRIFEVAIRSEKPFCADDLRDQLMESGFTVSTATVYNTLKLLTESGVLIPMMNVDGKEYYVTMRHTSSIALKCMKCGETHITRSAAVTNAIRGVKMRSFETQFFALTMFGLCSKCAKPAKKDEEKKKKNIKLINLNK